METVFIWCLNKDDGVHVVQPELTTKDEDVVDDDLPPLSSLGELLAD